MYRLLLLFVVACHVAPQDDVRDPWPGTEDIDAFTCDSGAFSIAAPVAGEHYDKSLDVLVDESGLWTQLAVTITDDAGDSYIPIAQSTAPSSLDAGIWWNRDTYHFELAPSTRYELFVSHCAASQTVSFFTSP